MPNHFILRGGRVVDPANGVDEIRDIGVRSGRIVPPESCAGAPVYDLDAKVVTPGFIDLHVHLRTPGQTHKEDIASGTRAAAAGGFTCVVAMPNTEPAVDCPPVLHELLERNRAQGVVRILQTAALTVERGGERLTDVAALKQAGATALTDDGTCIQEAALMLQALLAARDAGLPVIEHCEDRGIAAGGVVHAGQCSGTPGLPGQLALSEELIVIRDALLACESGWPVHLQHISSARSVQYIREARRQGVAISAEVTPHHLCLTNEGCRQYGTNAKMNPPLRTEADRQALIEGLRDGTIEAIATDHAPHTEAEKAVGLLEAPFGIIGLEAAVPVCLTELYHKGRLSLSQFVAKFTSGPARILGLPQHGLTVGGPADVTILDLEAEFAIDVATFRSRARNCPYDRWRCRGKPVATMVAGRWVFSELPGIPGLV